MNQIVTPQKNSNSIMQMTRQKRKVSLVMRAAFMMICALCFAIPAQAQQALKMTNGTRQVPNNGFLFYDSGGPLLFDPAVDPENANEYNWTTWYQHNEDYTLTLTVPEGKGIQVVFTKCRINNDFLYFYEGDAPDEANLISILTCNDYSSNMDAFTVVSHGNMTIRFESDYHWRDEGWEATITQTDEFIPQPPVAVMAACANQMVLIPTCSVESATMQYKLGDGSWQDYTTTGAWVDLSTQTFPLTVTTRTKVGEDSYSEESTFTFSKILPPGVPGGPVDLFTVDHQNDHNKVVLYFPDKPVGVNDTYYIRWTINNNPTSANENPLLWDAVDHEFREPSNSNSNVPGGEIDYTDVDLALPFYIHLAMRGTTCPELFSGVVTVEVTQRHVPMPTISFETSGSNGVTTLACSLEESTIYYTTNGSTPTTSSTQYTGTFDVQPGTTVKAIAVKSGYEPSVVASAIFLPGGGGSGSNGVYGGIVLLDDREEHSWSYYSDGNQPIHSLKPADVKITYFGNGTGTVSTTDGPDPAANSWTADATGVQVGPNDPGDQFIYLKTLERENENGSGDLPYTMIPNPFSKRPTNGNLSSETREIRITPEQSYAQGELQVEYTDANNQTAYYPSQNNWAIVYPNNNLLPPFTITVKSGTTIIFRVRQTADWSQYGQGLTNNDTYAGLLAEYADDNTFIWEGKSYSNNNVITGNANVQGAIVPDYRGFYAWRVKRLGGGLTIFRANGTEVHEGDMIDAEEAIKFHTSNEEGNEVDFEALWAKAYVVTSNTTTGLNANVSYERNFVVGVTSLGTPLSVPATYSSYYPNGIQAYSGAVMFNGVPNQTIGGNSGFRNFLCENDTKFEYMNLQGGTYDIITANNHYLCLGRGISTSQPASGFVQGINCDQTYEDLNYTLRVESGIYGKLSFIVDGRYFDNPDIITYGNNVTGRVQVKSILGCDYDRASGVNNLLQVSNNNTLYYSRFVHLNGQSNKDEKVFDCVIKSGQFQQSYWSGQNADGNSNHNLYCGPNNGWDDTYPGIRYVTIEGGELASMNGGEGTKDYYGNNGGHASNNVVNLYVRIKNGVFNGSVFGGASDNVTNGGRSIIMTGGTVKGWIAGGCNGTGTGAAGSLATVFGDSYIYVGGNALVGGPEAMTVNTTLGGQVFGSGRGAFVLNNDTGEYFYQKASVYNSNVVIADNATVSNENDNRGGNVYGGGNFGCVDESANVYVLGGTVEHNVYGGAIGNRIVMPQTNVYVRGGVVNGSVYGGSNEYGMVGSTTGTGNTATVIMSGGTTTNVYGGGLGEETVMANGTTVTVTGGTISNNVYGGGEEGTVTGNTNVTFGGGTVKNVFGAGKGNAEVTPAITALISGQTKVNISGGTVSECVYGGGEAGDVDNGLGNLASTVVLNGGNVNQDVFGGGRLGKTTGNVIVNMYDGVVGGNVFGGAFGSRNTVFIAGTHTVNIMGGVVYTNVYGGSRQADDALSFTPTAGEDMVNCVNISGGHIYYQVFAGGFFGQNYGSVYAFVGQNAINNAPYHAPTEGLSYNVAQLIIDGSVWAGADFGAFDGSSFGAATVEGRSNVYIDGLGYNTVSTQPSSAGYMNIGTSVLGVGTSCYAGKSGSDLIFRNYGETVSNPNYSAKDAVVEPYTAATRNLKSIQFFNDATIDKAHVHYIGQGRINSLLTTEKYALYEIIDTLRVVNGSSLFIDFPIDQMRRMGSYTCPDVYASKPTFTVVDYTDLPTAGHDNKFRVNSGSFINVKYLNGFGTDKHFGEFIGYFYVMTDDENSVCAYARPKQSCDNGNQIDTSYDNPLDGGFLSYHAEQNIYSYGTLTGDEFADIEDAPGDVGENGVQMAYENHTLNTTPGSKNGEQYFRIWRYGGIRSYRQGVFNAVAQSSANAGYSTVDVVIDLPASRGEGSYYRIKTVDGFPLVDYGGDLLMVNAGAYTSSADKWMYYVRRVPGDPPTDGSFETTDDVNDEHLANGLSILHENPNANFGLVAIPQGCLVNSGNTNWLICNDASDENELLTQTTWMNDGQNLFTNPSILFRLTYYNQLTNNVVWDPVTIIFEQCDADGNVKDEVEVALSVSTSTTIEQDFTAQTFAVMKGEGTQADTYVAKVVLPSYFPHVAVPGELSNWVFKDAEWLPNTETNTNSIHPYPVPDPNPGTGTEDFTDSWQTGSDYLIDEDNVIRRFSMQIRPSYNFDNTLGWTSFDPTAHDLKTITENTLLSSTDGRHNAAFDFILHYDGTVASYDELLMGVLHVTLQCDNFKSPDPQVTTPITKEVIFDVQVWRRGTGVNFYIDGVHGDNIYYDGTYPDAAKKSLSGIFNHSDWKPGDNIFIVNTVTANGSAALDWNGEEYGQVLIYRYPGGHPLSPYTNSTNHYVDYSTTYPDNMGFAGPLVQVETSMSIHGIVLDGFQYIRTTTTPNPQDPSNILYYNPDAYVTPTAPLISVAENANLTVYGQSGFQWNYSNGNGGAINNAGTIYINDGSYITNNAVVSNDYHGGGVYLGNGATLIVSDAVNITDNHVVTHTGNATSSDPNNNVYLVSEGSVIQVGTLDPNDDYAQLDANSKIGVTKGDWGRYYYTPIAYSEVGSEHLGNLIPADEETPAADYLIFDDGLYYHLVTLNNTETYEPSYNYLFWVGTWVTAVHSKPSTYTEVPDGGTAIISNANDLAWAISVVNGLNDHPANPNTNFNVTADIDMAANIWVPIGTHNHPYTGTFDAQGHNITGIHSPLNSENMGMFGIVNSNSTIENMVVSVDFSGGNSVNMGGVAAVVNGEGTTITNVEAAGNITGTSTTEAIGGIVAVVNPPTGTNPKPHTIGNVFSVATMTATNPETLLGGLVGDNAADLINSYANATMSGSDHIGGLVSRNKGHIENCYSVIGEQTFPAFADRNVKNDDFNGEILICYTDKSTDDPDDCVKTRDAGSTLDGYATYGTVLGRKALGYMYYDNAVGTITGTNSFVHGADIDYTNNHKINWNGLLWALNNWVNTNENYHGCTPWFRPTSGEINGDLPILAFPSDNSLGTTDVDGKFLQYGSIVGTNANGIDQLLVTYNDNMNGAASSLFLYGSATEVNNVPKSNVKVYINEDAVLKQSSTAGDFINTTVGITFDNSYKSASDYFGNGTGYDWHFLSSSLTEAPMGITYGKEGVTFGYGNPADISVMEGNYFPNGLMSQSEVAWDLYSFYEPQYHWINLKRSTENHWHFDYPHGNIEYTNETIFTPGKGYMAAISQDSYLNNTGTLNKADFTIGVTSDSYDPGITEIGYNLLGNPYQAYLDMSAFMNNDNNKALFENSYWVYIAEGDNYIAGNFAASDNVALPSGTLHPHQAFFVKVKQNNGSNTGKDGMAAQFTYGMATADAQAYSFFRGNKVNYPLVNLKANNERGMQDLAVIEFNRPEMGGSNKLRALNNASFELCSHMDGEDYSILFAPEGTERVPVRFRTKEDGTFTLTWETMHGEFSSLLLVDNMTGTVTDMLRADRYTFDAGADDYASRFYITYRVTDVEEHSEGDGTFAWFDGSEWIVEGQGVLDVVDVMGRTVYSERLVNERNRVGLNGVAKGVYLLRVSDGTNTMVQKIVVR